MVQKVFCAVCGGRFKYNRRVRRGQTVKTSCCDNEVVFTGKVIKNRHGQRMHCTVQFGEFSSVSKPKGHVGHKSSTAFVRRPCHMH